ncbi:MAG: hypothetical protein HUU43_14915 [Ignavibacteriaceae bacterium]|nr:hypothetical protein [Ignavibacteriaceae bacterium]
MRKLLLLIAAVSFLTGCNEKFDIGVFDSQKGTSNIGGDTVYVELTPSWGGFTQPHDVYVGNDYFVYVTDPGAGKLVMLNQAGERLSEISVPGVLSVAQDYKLNLIVTGKFDTLINGSNVSVSAIYKIDMYASGHNLGAAQLKRILPAPGRAFSEKDLRVNYTGVCAFYDNSFYVARSGPGNTSIFDPDNSILIFETFSNGGVTKDSLIGRVPGIEPLGTGILSANYVTSLVSFNRRNIDFIMTMNGDNSFRTQWLTYVISQLGEEYESRLTPGGVEIMKPGKFIVPADVTLDRFNNIYVADPGTDSIYKFNTFGDELESFGGASVFNNPTGVAHFDRVLYVADQGNGKIRRFTLSTDLR